MDTKEQVVAHIRSLHFLERTECDRQLTIFFSAAHVTSICDVYALYEQKKDTSKANELVILARQHKLLGSTARTNLALHPFVNLLSISSMNQTSDQKRFAEAMSAFCSNLSAVSEQEQVALRQLV